MTEASKPTRSDRESRSDAALHLMSLVPDPSFTATYHALDMSPELHNALIDLFDGCSTYNLDTRVLKTQLLQYLDQPVQVQPISRYRDAPIPDWIMTNAPIDLARLRTIISNWIWSTCPEAKRSEDEHRRVLDLITQEGMAEHVHTKCLPLFDEHLRPADKRTFAGFAVSVCDSIDGRTCHLSCGQDLVFERMLGGTESHCELLSQILWHKEFPYAISLSLGVETVPPRRETRLNVKASVRRFAHGSWTFKKGYTPHLANEVNALVRWPGGRWRTVPYGYGSHRKRIDWNEASARNLKDFTGIELPDLTSYLRHMVDWALPGRELQILSPQAVSTRWQTSHRVERGLSINDKAEIFEFVASCLEGIAIPSTDPEPIRRKNLVKLFEEKKLTTAAERDAWALANRRRLSAATHSNRIELEFIGTQADIRELALAREETIAFLGPEGEVDGIRVGMTTRTLDHLLTALSSGSVAGARERMDDILKTIGKAENGIPTACIVLLPNYSLDKSLSQRDPKQAIRMGLALSGRLAQFLVPPSSVTSSISHNDSDANPERSEGDSFGHRATSAVRDLMRQLGFIYDFKDSTNLKPQAPLYGIHLVAPLGRFCRIKEALIATRVNFASGESDALLPQLNMAWIPYWQAQLQLARMTNPLNTTDSIRADGHMLKRLVDKLRGEAPEDSLLLVRSYGYIRRKEWWPGISDEGLSRGPLRYGPTAERGAFGSRFEDIEFEQGDSNLNILRVRVGDEVPDYYTDLSATSPIGKDGRPQRANKQAIFKANGYFLALVPKPGDKQYRDAYYGSKFDWPGRLMHARSLVEYVLLTSRDESLALECTHRAEASRANMVQLLKSDMKVNLPAPLHLAVQMEEYIWNPRP